MRYAPAQKRLDYAGVYAPERVTRVAESVVGVESDVEAALSFAIDNQRLTVISGHADVRGDSTLPALQPAVFASGLHDIQFQSDRQRRVGRLRCCRKRTWRSTSMNLA